VSREGTLAYLSAERLGNNQYPELAWYDRSGRRLELAAPAGEYRNPGLSPDGKYVAFERGTPSDIWVLELQKGLSPRLTTNPAPDVFPVWSPDGRTIAFVSGRDTGSGIYTREVGVVGEDKLMAQTAAIGTDDWSRENYILYDSASPDRHIWGVPTSGGD